MEQLSKNMAELKQTFKSGRTKGIAWRKAQLRAILKLIEEKEDQIFQVLLQDLGKNPVESFRDEVSFVKASAKNALDNLEKWMAPKKGPLPLALFPSKAEVVPEPLGLVLIFGSWNVPLILNLDPLIGAISAGNVAVLKPSELAPASSSFLANTLPHYLDSKAIKVIEGGADAAEQLQQEKWDKIFFTGSPKVGRLVMSAAAKHLTPVTLELGGKCPTILDSLPPSDLEVAVKRIVAGKWGSCSGQVCIGVDYLLVEQKLAPLLVEMLKKCVKNFFGESLQNLRNLCRIVNKYHFNRVSNLLKESGVSASIVHGGSFDEENLMIEPTILLNPPLDAEIMTDEIFGPLLPIITLNKIEESIEFINSRPKPLALYAFTKNKTLKEKILQETSSGSIAFNDTIVQVSLLSLPFVGVGTSGFGRYHGKYSFDNFSHEKAVLHRSFYFELEPRYPPWNDFKLEFLRLIYNTDYLGLLLLFLGLKRNYASNRQL